MKPRQRTCRRASGMTTCSAPMPAFGRTACGRNAGRSSMIPSCIAIASELSTHMSRSGRDIDGAARDYPTRQSGRANLRRDNQRRRRWDPRPSNWGPPARHKEPTRHSSAAPMRRNRSAFPFAQMARALGASRSSPHASPNCCRPLLAQRRALDQSSLALSSNPAKQRGPLPGHSIGPRGWSAPSALGRRWISS